MGEPPSQVTLAVQVAERLEKLSMEELALIGRPKGRPTEFLHVKGDMFVYQVAGKRFDRHNLDEVRSLIKDKASDNEEQKKERNLALGKLLLKPLYLSRKTVARNASERIMEQIRTHAKTVAANNSTLQPEG